RLERVRLHREHDHVGSLGEVAIRVERATTHLLREQAGPFGVDVAHDQAVRAGLPERPATGERGRHVASADQADDQRLTGSELRYRRGGASRGVSETATSSG